MDHIALKFIHVSSWFHRGMVILNWLHKQQHFICRFLQFKYHLWLEKPRHKHSKHCLDTTNSVVYWQAWSTEQTNYKASSCTQTLPLTTHTHPCGVRTHSLVTCYLPVQKGLKYMCHLSNDIPSSLPPSRGYIRYFTPLIVATYINHFSPILYIGYLKIADLQAHNASHRDVCWCW